MEKAITLIIICLAFFQIQAKQKSTGRNTHQNWKCFQESNRQSAKQSVQNKAALSLSNHDVLQLATATKDELGFTHYRYQQTYQGLPVEGAVYLMHEKDGEVELSNGRLVHWLNINTKPTLSKASARKLAIKHIDAKLYAWQSAAYETSFKQSKKDLDASYFPKGSLTIVDPRFSQNASNYHLAYKFKVFALEPFAQNEVYVDAHNGEILLVVDNIHSCTETNINAQTNYSGNVNISVCSDDGTPTHLKSSQYGGLEVRDYVNNNLISIDDSLAAEVLWATEKTFDYFSIHHNRNISDSLTISKINNSGDFYGAYYRSSEGIIIYCDGNGTTHNPYTTTDIVGHELTHGVNKFSADLENLYESGALNESFADIFGQMVEDHCLGGTDWILGAPVSPNNSGLRNLSNPKDKTMKSQQPNTYLGENWILRSSPCIKFNDYCGTHRNSGVQNYWFYLLAAGGTGINDNDFNYTVSGIGKVKAAQIAYRNLTTYLTPSSGYNDARQGSIQAAIDLFGVNSFEVQQTRKAWRAVGVTNNPIKIKSANEAILADGSIQFELLVDSLDQMISASGLTIYLDTENNYDIVSVELIHPDLSLEEITTNAANNKQIIIDRANGQHLRTKEALFKITASLNPNAILNSLSSFEINGGTLTSDAGFIPFEDAVLNIPLNNCVNETGLANWLPVVTSIEYETCAKAGLATVKILDSGDANPPYAHIWTDVSDLIVFQYVGYEQLIEIPNLPVGIYNVTVSDTGGNCTSFETKIPFLSNRDGNNLFSKSCPDYLITPNENLQGIYSANVELEVMGFVGKTQNASFIICN